MKITVSGTGFVGFSKAVLLAQHNQFLNMDLKAEQCLFYDVKIALLITKGRLEI